jgi:hypothetical protein
MTIVGGIQSPSSRTPGSICWYPDTEQLESLEEKKVKSKSKKKKKKKRSIRIPSKSNKHTGELKLKTPSRLSDVVRDECDDDLRI